jgi:hypothetical protein
MFNLLILRPMTSSFLIMSVSFIAAVQTRTSSLGRNKFYLTVHKKAEMCGGNEPHGRASRLPYQAGFFVPRLDFCRVDTGEYNTGLAGNSRGVTTMRTYLTPDACTGADNINKSHSKMTKKTTRRAGGLTRAEIEKVIDRRFQLLLHMLAESLGKQTEKKHICHHGRMALLSAETAVYKTSVEIYELTDSDNE